MQETSLIFGALFAGMSVIFGAFGAHALKKKFTPDLQKSFETGVKYQMYHALALLIIGFALDLDSTYTIAAAFCFIFGILLFSFSIYGLCITSSNGRKWKFLGPITPIGGLLLVTGWILLLLTFLDF